MFAQRLLETQELYQTVLNNLTDGIYLVDTEQNILIWNDAAAKITGYTQEEMATQSALANALDHIDKTGAPLCHQDCPIYATLRDGEKRTTELFLRHKRGYRVPVLFKTQPIREDGEIVGAMAVFSDNSVRVQGSDIVSSLAKLMMTDQLTGLSNKHYTQSMLETMLEGSHRYGSKLCVLYINLDDFSRCNEDYGYETGNQMLVRLAEAFRRNLRKSDFVGRWGGEEFVGIFEVISGEHLKLLTEKIRAMVETTTLSHLGDSVRVTASIGATLCGGEESPRELIDRAASLMHVSKISGKNCVTIG